MTTQTTVLSPHPLPTPLLLPGLARLLLAPTTAFIPPTAPDLLAPELLTVRATHITVLLSQILDDKGYRHGGINE